MIDLSSLTHYEVLDIEPSATAEEIRRAYEIALRTYGTQHMATTGLFTPLERQQILYRVHQAYKVLMDPRSRLRYDQQIGVHHPAKAEGLNVGRGGMQDEMGQQREVMQAQQEEELQRKRQAVNEIIQGAVESGLWNGGILRQIRETLGLTVDEIASKTKISRGHIKSIEEDSFEYLPPDIYVKGFLNEIAKFMGLEPGIITPNLMEHIKRKRGPR